MAAPMFLRIKKSIGKNIIELLNHLVNENNK